MKRRHALIALLALPVGCTTLAQTRYYSLAGGSPPSGLPVSNNGTPDYRVAIGPVNVPESLDRLQIVLRVAPNRYQIADTERWTEPLKRGIPRVIAEEVGQQLRNARVASDQQHNGRDADYRVLIDVLRFESAPGESATLEALWTVRSRSGDRLWEARSILIEQVETTGIAPLVAAHGRALARFSSEIADVLSEVARDGR